MPEEEEELTPPARGTNITVNRGGTIDIPISSLRCDKLVHIFNSPEGHCQCGLYNWNEDGGDRGASG